MEKPNTLSSCVNKAAIELTLLHNSVSSISLSSQVKQLNSYVLILFRIIIMNIHVKEKRKGIDFILKLFG